MRVLFLDIDCVLNSWRPMDARVHAEGFDPVAWILDSADATFVVSSSWREGRSKEEMVGQLASGGLPTKRLHADWATPKIQGRAATRPSRGAWCSRCQALVRVGRPHRSGSDRRELGADLDERQCACGLEASIQCGRGRRPLTLKLTAEEQDWFERGAAELMGRSIDLGLGSTSAPQQLCVLGREGAGRANASNAVAESWGEPKACGRSSVNGLVLIASSAEHTVA